MLLWKLEQEWQQCKIPRRDLKIELIEKILAEIGGMHTLGQDLWFGRGRNSTG